MKLMKPFQIRWAEKLYQGSQHYLTRWTFIFFNYSIRVHHWLQSDVGPHLHDHPFDFISIVLKGSYINSTPTGEIKVKAPSIWFSEASKRHRLIIPKEGTWTLLICGKPYKKWGFFVNNHLWRPLRYFSKFGVKK